jgi:predicted nucleotide-binding protein
MKIYVLIHPKCSHRRQVEEALKTVSKLQSHFHFVIQKPEWLPNGGAAKVTPAELRAIIGRKYKKKPTIAIIINRFTDDYFSHDWRELAAVTTYDWETHFAPPPLGIYLIYEIAEALLHFAVDLPDDLIQRWQHGKSSRGCILDFCRRKKDIRLGMVGGNLCGECETKFFEMGLTDQALDAVEQLLAHVRNAMIRRPREAPSRVFIGHGRSTVWMRLRDFLTAELGLEVEEFNHEPAAGISTTDRLRDMLSRTRVAFLVLTAEDEHGDHSKHARENVVHEVGLFQGKLGFNKAIIMKERKCAEFSNIHGLTYIPFSKQRFNNAKAEIRRTLEREGIIELATRHK